MSPAALFFASGDSLYLGAILLLIAIADAPFARAGWRRHLRNIVVFCGTALIAIAAPPIEWLAEAIFFILLALWFVVWNRDKPGMAAARARFLVSPGLAALLLLVAAEELAHRSMPAITGQTCDHLVVIGDSISSGIDPRVPSWPRVFEQTTGLQVKNLALPGADTAEAELMSAKVIPDDKVILVEIGGNDMLNDVPASVFAARMGTILSGLAAPGRTIAMFELPLPPNQSEYGRVQRRLASKYHVWLIPKRYFVKVISGPGATSDGIHLNVEGTRRMAALVASSLAAVLKARALNGP